MIIDIFVWRLNDKTVLSADTFLKIMIELGRSHDKTRENCQRSRLTLEYFEPL